ncbi:WSC domain-containing protein 1 [Metarhizium anisopliae]
MKLHTIAATAALVGTGFSAKNERTFAVLRFTNKQLTKGRMDPIVSPGQVSTHVHSIFGGSNFGLGSTGKDLMDSKCTTAMIKGDNSNYWVPSLYFKDPKTGKLEDVELFYANAYYFFEPTNDDIKAFPVGLSIMSGDQTIRTPPKDGATSNLDPSKGTVNPIKWTCPRSNFDTPSWPAGSNGLAAGIQDPNNKGEGVGFPDVNCDGYASPLRADVHFPSCYNPAAGLTNYKENMAFPTDDGKGKQDCPKGWIHVPHLFLEVYWNTPLFKDRWEQGKGQQPFVLSNGDATGYSNHADFMAAWDEKLLQHIIDTCNAGSQGMDKCPGLNGLNKDDCTIKSQVDETVDGVLDALPGDNPITGWSYGGNGTEGGGNEPKPSQSQSQSTGGDNTAKPSSTSKAGGDNTSTAKPTNSQPGQPTNSQPAQPTNSQPTQPTNSQPTQPTNSQPTGGDNTSKVSSAAPTSDNKPTSTKNPDNATTKPQPTSEAGSSKPTLPSQPSACTPKVHTVYETITVTAQLPGATDRPVSNSTRTTGDFKYAGCFKDSRDRVLKADVRPNLGAISNAKCVAHCKAKNYKLAGTEYGGQCYCGNELVRSEKLDDSECNIACEGDKSDTCGGGWALTVFSKDGEASLKDAKSRRHAHEHLQRHRSPHY